MLKNLSHLSLIVLEFLIVLKIWQLIHFLHQMIIGNLSEFVCFVCAFVWIWAFDENHFQKRNIWSCKYSKKLETRAWIYQHYEKMEHLIVVDECKPKLQIWKEPKLSLLFYLSNQGKQEPSRSENHKDGGKIIPKSYRYSRSFIIRTWTICDWIR